jgi:hypothetical protein
MKHLTIIIAFMLLGFYGQAQSTLGLNPESFDILGYSPLILLLLIVLIIWLWLAMIFAPLFIWKWTKRTAREIRALREEMQIMNAERTKRY